MVGLCSTAGRAAVLAVLIVTVFLHACASREAVQPPQQRAKVALVLGAGTSRGFAHIGVLKVLETSGVPIHLIIGTSAGSFVGSLYAYGFNAFQLQKMAFAIEKGDIIDLMVPDNGFIKGDKLESYVNGLLKNASLEKMRIPFYAVATEVPSGQEVVFGRGNAGKAVRASCSIPGVFRPALIEGRMYVDGGVVSPVAVEAAVRLGADMVIAVDISTGVETRQPETTIETLLQSLDIMHARLAASQLVKADVVIRPDVRAIGASDFTKRHEAILEGERAATESLPRIRSILDRLRRQGRLD